MTNDSMIVNEWWWNDKEAQAKPEYGRGKKFLSLLFPFACPLITDYPITSVEVMKWSHFRFRVSQTQNSQDQHVNAALQHYIVTCELVNKEKCWLHLPPDAPPALRQPLAVCPHAPYAYRPTKPQPIGRCLSEPSCASPTTPMSNQQLETLQREWGACLP